MRTAPEPRTTADERRRAFTAWVIATTLAWVVAIAWTHGLAGQVLSTPWLVVVALAGSATAWLVAGPRRSRPGPVSTQSLPLWTWLSYGPLVALASGLYIVARGPIALVELGLPTLAILLLLTGLMFVVRDRAQ